VRCQECRAEADELALGWRAYRGDGSDEGEEPFLLFYCPVCAEREFGPFPAARDRQPPDGSY
jgi:hypothetical protein